MPPRERYLACLAVLSTRLLQTRDPENLLGEAVSRLREASGADRCYVFENGVAADDSIRVTIRAESCAEGVPPAMGRPELIDAPLTVFDRPELVRGEPFHGPPAAFGPTARAIIEREGALWLVFLPIRVEGAWWGTLGFATYRDDLRFEDADVALLRTAANTIGAALERARQEQAVRASEQRFRRIADQAFDLIAEVDAAGRYLYVSPSHEPVVGVPAATLVGRSVYERLHPDDHAHVRRAFVPETVATPGRAVFRMRHADGSWRWIEALGRFHAGVRDASSFVVIGRDVTERRRLDEERARLEQAMDQAGDVIAIWDREGRVVFVNAAWERAMGIPRSAAVGRPIRDFAVLSMTDDRVGDMDRALRADSAWKGRLRRRDGGTVDTSIAAVRDGSGAIRHFIAVTRDVTREVELESRLRQQQKLEAIGTLATGVAHDFNNLLTGVLGYAELLEKDEIEPDALREAVGVIGQAARRGAELTAQLLRFSPRARRASGPVDVHELVNEVVGLTARTFPRSVEVRAELDADRSTVEGDAGQLQQVLLNLVVNARDAMEAGGVLRIRTEVRSGARPQLALRVSDTGAGIDEALRERIFEPFFTTKPREKGTGLGLAVAYGIVQSHGGSIRVESAPGRGATFEVCLPLSDAPAPPRRAAPPPSAAGVGRVLVVDDEPSVRRVAARMLQRLGYETGEAADGHEALRSLRDGAESFDLVLLDLDMPGLDGRACLLALRDLAPTLPVLLSTGLPTGELDTGVLEAVAGVLPKPYELAELGRVVAEALAGRR